MKYIYIRYVVVWFRKNTIQSNYTLARRKQVPPTECQSRPMRVPMERATSGLGGIVVKKLQISKLKVGANVIRCLKFKEVYGGFLEWWYPTTIAFPTKNDHFGMSWGYQHLRKHPYNYLVYEICLNMESTKLTWSIQPFGCIWTDQWLDSRSLSMIFCRQYNIYKQPREKKSMEPNNDYINMQPKKKTMCHNVAGSFRFLTHFCGSAGQIAGWRLLVLWNSTKATWSRCFKNKKAINMMQDTDWWSVLL